MSKISFLFNSQFKDEQEATFGGALRKLFSTSSDVMIAVAYVSSNGLACIWTEFENLLKSGGSAEVVIGLDWRITHPDAVRMLYDASRLFCRFTLYGVSINEPCSIYHPKMYFFTGKGKGTFLLGSSNLTGGGLEQNLEANVQIEAEDDCDVFWDALDFYYVCSAKANPIILTDEYIDLYNKAHFAYHESLGELSMKFSESRRNLVDCEAGMRKAGKDRIKLSPWCELVLSKLPEGEFTNEDIYAFEGEFREVYPDNMHIRPKIRQQLQILRDLGFIEFLPNDRKRRI